MPHDCLLFISCSKYPSSPVLSGLRPKRTLNILLKYIFPKYSRNCEIDSLFKNVIESLFNWTHDHSMVVGNLQNTVLLDCFTISRWWVSGFFYARLTAVHSYYVHVCLCVHKTQPFHLSNFHMFCITEHWENWGGGLARHMCLVCAYGGHANTHTLRTVTVRIWILKRT